MKELLNLEVKYFVYKVCSPAWRLEENEFLLHGLVLVLDGNACYWINKQKYQVTAGDLVYVHPGDLRAATTTGMTCAAIDFVVDNDEFGLPVVSRFVWTQELDRLLREFQYEWLEKKPGYQIKCGALFLLVLHALLYGREITGTNIHVEKIKRYIVEHLTERLSLRTLAALVGLNPVYCGALFRKTQGMTIAEYVNRIRVDRAVTLLEEGAHRISDIAYMCGFNDVYYFSATFKRLMGVSPSKYRAKLATFSTGGTKREILDNTH